MEINETLYRIEVTVRYGEPQIAALKTLGCQWDGLARVWWIGRMDKNADAVRDLVTTTTTRRSSFAQECERRRASGFAITVPYAHRQLAKQHGGIWDGFIKQWLMPSQAAAELVNARVSELTPNKRRAA